MEYVKKLIQEANKSLNVADHLVYITYPMLKDVKILTKITEHIYLSLLAAMEAVLQYDRLYKRIPPVAENLNLRYEVFKTKCAPRYNISRQHLLLINDLRDVIESRKKSPIEFTRKDKLVICSDTYKMKILTVDNVKNYLQQSKQFIEKINSIFKNV